MGNACSARSGRHAGAVPGEKKSGDSEGIQAGCVADQPQPTSAAGNLADAERHRPQGSIDEVSWERAVSDTRRSADESDAGPLAHTPSERRHGATDTPGTARRGGSEGGSVARRALDDTASARRQRTQPNAEGQARDEARLRLSSLGRGESYWGDADWIPCTDGKARPVEPGTFPLAHGVANRVGRLCAYGNAIVAPQAQAFISAYLERRPVKRAVTIQI
jgi:DNA (cytosine-5)-methyltransferase 1